MKDIQKAAMFNDKITFLFTLCFHFTIYFVILLPKQ